MLPAISQILESGYICGIELEIRSVWSLVEVFEVKIPISISMGLGDANRFVFRGLKIEFVAM